MTSTMNKEAEGAGGTNFGQTLLMAVHGFYEGVFLSVLYRRFLTLMELLIVTLPPQG